jgi:hypothetical protein
MGVVGEIAKPKSNGPITHSSVNKITADSVRAPVDARRISEKQTGRLPSATGIGDKYIGVTGIVSDRDFEL